MAKADTSFEMFKCSLSNFLALTLDNPATAGGHIFDDPSGSTDKLNEVKLK